MSFVGDIIGDVVGGITGSKDASKAAVRASETQSDAALAGIASQERQFDKLIELMAPYVAAGTQGLQGQQTLLGLNGEGARWEAISALENSVPFRAMLEQGENAILQNASATGGLRGGNVQAALGQFRPQILSSLIDQQYQRLGGLSQLGQAAASGQAAAGMNLGTNTANLLQQQGAALAGGQIAAGSANRQAFGDLLKIGSLVAGGF